MAVKAWSPNHWTTREVPNASHFKLIAAQRQGPGGTSSFFICTFGSAGHLPGPVIQMRKGAVLSVHPYISTHPNTCPWEFPGSPVPGAFTTMTRVQSLVKELRSLELCGSARNTQNKTQQQQKCLPLLEPFANLSHMPLPTLSGVARLVMLCFPRVPIWSCCTCSKLQLII